MTDDTETLALMGATGGAGTTRLTVEFGATLARDGRAVALLDAAFSTPGLVRHVPGRIDPDLTKIVTEDRPLSAGLVEYPANVAGQLAVCPAAAPFERVARAKTAGAARAFEDLLGTAADRFDRVLVDVPPVAANQAVAAVTAADRTALVVPATRRGADALGPARDRLDDLGVDAAATVANRVDGSADAAGIDADVRVPESDAVAVGDLPACLDPGPSFAPAVARGVETLLGTDLSLDFPEGGSLSAYVPDL